MKNNKKMIFGGLLIFLSMYMVAEVVYAFDGPSVISLGFSVFLILYAITKLLDRNFVEAFLGVGVFTIVNYNFLGIPKDSRWIMFWAALIMGVGLQTIFKKKRKSFKFQFNGEDVDFKSYYKDNVVDVDADINDREEPNKTHRHSSPQDYIDAETNFSDQKRYVRSENFTRGNLESNFGNLEVYFQSATFNPDGAFINVEANFGNITLYFPSTVNVQNNLKASLGAVTGDSMFISSDYPTVILEGSANFGKISVRYL